MHIPKIRGLLFFALHLPLWSKVFPGNKMIWVAKCVSALETDQGLKWELVNPPTPGPWPTCQNIGPVRVKKANISKTRKAVLLWDLLKKIFLLYIVRQDNFLKQNTISGFCKSPWEWKMYPAFPYYFNCFVMSTQSTMSHRRKMLSVSCQTTAYTLGQ